MLEGKGAILDVARAVSVAVNAAGIDAAVIGGIAVVLHHHIRTTVDVDLLVNGPLSEVSDCLQAAGATFDSSRREFLLNQVPVHLLTSAQTGFMPAGWQEIDGIRTVALEDLISLKLSSGSTSVLRSQDIADVLGLIRANQLTDSFTPTVAKPFRQDFRKLLKALSNES